MNIAIILSGGVGNRMGADVPKQYILVDNQPVVSYCLDTFTSNQNVDMVGVVVAEEWEDFVKEQVEKLETVKTVFFARPGATRQFSIFNGLKAARQQGADDSDVVIIHDAARPLVSHELIDRCIEGCKQADGVMPAIPVKDTTYFSKDGKHIHSLLDRSCLWAGQAPEAFRFGKYLKAHEEMSTEELMKIVGSTELAFKSGLNCVMTEGDPMNFKITTPDDLMNFQQIISKKR